MPDNNTNHNDSMAMGVVELPVPGTPRFYQVRHSTTPFRLTHKFRSDEPAWIKLGRGLIAVADESKSRLVAPGLIFGVEDVDGEYKIGVYGRRDRADQIGIGRPFTVSSLRSSITREKYMRIRWTTYQDMILAVRRAVPTAWVPTEAEFLAEYGITQP